MLKLAVQFLLTVSLATATSRAADSPFVGKWQLNPSKSRLTDVMKVDDLGGHTYAFNFGGGPETIVLNGTDQAGNFGTTLSVAAEAPKTWRIIRKVNGRISIAASWNLSADASELTDHFTGFNPDGSTYKLDYLYKRKRPGAGFEGEWVSTSETVNSSISMQVRLYQGDGLSFFDSSTQMTRNAQFDGRDYPNNGPNAISGSTCSLRRMNERALEMACKVNGKLLYTQQIQLSSDLKTMTMTRHIVGESETNIQVFERD